MGVANLLHLTNIYKIASHRITRCSPRKEIFYKKVINKAVFRLEKAGVEIKMIDEADKTKNSINESVLRRFLTT